MDSTIDITLMIKRLGLNEVIIKLKHIYQLINMNIDSITPDRSRVRVS